MRFPRPLPNVLSCCPHDAAAAVQSGLRRMYPEISVREFPSVAALVDALSTTASDVVLLPEWGPGPGLDLHAMVALVRARRPYAYLVLVTGAESVHGLEELSSGTVDDLLLIGECESRAGLMLARAGRRAQLAQSSGIARIDRTVTDLEQRLGMILRAVRAAPWDWDLETNIVSWPGATAALGGRPAEPYAGSIDAFMEMVHPDDRPTIESAFNRALAGPDPYSVEYRLSVPDGQTQWMIARGHVFRDESGRPLRMQGVSIDVTEFHQTQLALAAAEQRFRQITEIAAQGLFTFDGSDRVDYANPAAAAAFGCSVSDLIGKSPVDLVHPDSRHEVERRSEARSQGWTGLSHCRLLRKDGTWFWGECTGALLRDGEGRPAGRLMVFSDITARIEREAQLSTDALQKEVLLREVHHRVRNNFQIISSLFNLQFSDSPDTELRERVRETQSRITTMALLHSLLYESEDVASADAGSYLERIAASLQQAYADRCASVHLHVSSEPMRFCTDIGMRIGLIVNELVTNALKHAFPDGREGRVDVSLARSAEFPHLVSLVVQDDGIGFGAGDPMDNADTLGLNLVGDMVRQLDGTMRFADLSAGARITMMFPAGRILT